MVEESLTLIERRLVTLVVVAIRVMVVLLVVLLMVRVLPDMVLQTRAVVILPVRQEPPATVAPLDHDMVPRMWEVAVILLVQPVVIQPQAQVQGDVIEE